MQAMGDEARTGAELSYALTALTDPIFQQSVWCDGRLPRPGYVYSFDEAIRSILEDAAEAPRCVWKSDAEAEAVAALVIACERLVRQIGRVGTFSQALSSPA